MNKDIAVTLQHNIILGGMSMKKKVLTLLFALAMLFSLTITVAAQENVEPATYVY